MLASIVLVAGNLCAGKNERHHVDDVSSKFCVPTLRVKKDASIGGTLRAEDAWIGKLDVCDVQVNCCDRHDCSRKEKSSVVVTCEKCVNNIRGVVNVKANVFPNQFNPNGVTSAEATILAGCGFKIVPGSVQLISTDITTQYQRIGMIIPFTGAARTVALTFRVCLCKPCCDRLAVTSTAENNFAVNSVFADVVSPTVFDLTGKENIFLPGTFFSDPTYVAVEAAEVVINQVDEFCFNINYVVSLVANSCSVGAGPERAHDAISQVQLAALSTVVNPQAEGLTLNFIEQCPIKCKKCDPKHDKHDKHDEDKKSE